SDSTAWFRAQPQSFAEVPSAKIAYRKFGSGPPLLCIHGWPFSSLSYRFVARALAAEFTCYFPDTPGLGDTVWRDPTRFKFAQQAETFRDLLDKLELERTLVLAHDTGATIARQLAL